MYQKREFGEFTNLINRSASAELVDKEKRYMQIWNILGDKEMTAKEIAVEMYMRCLTDSSERNYSAPRLTEMSRGESASARKYPVDIVGTKKCQYTGRPVSVYARRVSL